MMALDWQRGLLRTWLLLSLAWVSFAGYQSVSELLDGKYVACERGANVFVSGWKSRVLAVDGKPLVLSDGSCSDFEKAETKQRLKHAASVFLPPFLLLGVAHMILWVIKGFRKKETI